MLHIRPFICEYVRIIFDPRKRFEGGSSCNSFSLNNLHY